MAYKPAFTTTTTRPTFTPVTTTPTFKPVVTTPVNIPPPAAPVTTPPKVTTTPPKVTTTPPKVTTTPPPVTTTPPPITTVPPPVTTTPPPVTVTPPPIAPAPAPAPKEIPKAKLGSKDIELLPETLGPSAFVGGAGNVPFSVRMVLKPSNIKQTGNAPVTNYGIFDVNVDYVLRSDVDTLRRYGFNAPAVGKDIGFDEVEVSLTPEQAKNLGLTTSTQITFPNLGNQSGDDLNRAILYQVSQNLGVPSSIDASSLFTQDQIDTAKDAVNIQNQLREQYQFIVENYPEAAYGGRSRDLDDVFASQAFDLAKNGVGSIYDITQQVVGNKTFIVNKNTGQKLFEVTTDPDTKATKWGENLRVEGGANYGIQFNEEGVPVFFPVYEKSDSGTLGQVFGFVLPILGAYIGGPAGAAIGSTIGQLGETGEVDFKRVVQSAIAAVGTTQYATQVGTALGVTNAVAAPIVGNAVINAGLSGIAAAVTGANIEKSMLDGAVKGAAMVSTKDIAEAILGKDNIASLAKITGLKTSQIESIFTTALSDGLRAEITGDGEFLEAAKNSLISQGVGATAANLMDSALAETLKTTPAIKRGIVQAVGSIAQLATNAELQGQDIQTALKNNAAGIILVTLDSIRKEDQRQEVIRKIKESQNEIDNINQTAIDIASGKVQIAGLPFVAYGLSIGAHAALAYLVSQYESLFPDDVETQKEALEANPIYIEIQNVAPSVVVSEISPKTNKPKLIVKAKPDLSPDAVTELEDITIKVQSDPTLAESQRISDEVFELLKQFFEQPRELEPIEVPPPPPIELKPGPAAEREEGASGEAGEAGEAGGFTGPPLPSPQKIADIPTRETIFNFILNDELQRIEKQLQESEKIAQEAQANFQRAQEQQRKFSTPDIIARVGPDLAETLERELNLTAQSAQDAQAARAAAAAEREAIGAVQRGEQTLSDQQLLEYLQTGDISFGRDEGGTTPGGRGEGEGEPGTRGPGTGADEEGPGPGGLEEGDESGAGDRGFGPGAGQEGTEVGGGGEGEGGAGELRTPLRPSLIFDRETGGRPTTTPFGSRVTGEALASILGEKEPLFGGDEDEQRAVWNRRSLRLLSRALGL